MKVVSDKNRLSICFPELLKEWDYDKNEIKPNEVSFGSRKKVWWKCDKEHSWKTTIANRTNKDNKNKCPYCVGRLPSKENNLSLHKCSKEFDYEKNFPFTPKDYTPSSTKKIWWKCDKGHSWEAIIGNRTSKHNKTKCPYCVGRKPSKENNLSLHPVSKEFDYEKNYPLKPKDFTLNSTKKVWWKCDKEHSWEAVIKNRTLKKNARGCKECSLKKFRSKGEIELFEWCCETFSKQKIEANKRGLFSNKNYEIDIWFPEINKGIEFNGNYWHSKPKRKKNDKTKLQEAKEKGIVFFIVWEDEWNDNKKVIKNKIKKWCKKNEKENL